MNDEDRYSPTTANDAAGLRGCPFCEETDCDSLHLEGVKMISGTPSKKTEHERHIEAVGDTIKLPPRVTEPWSERIPAAIEKAKGMLDMWECRMMESLYLNRNQADLAEMGWEATQNLDAEFGGEYTPPALIAFCETVEQLAPGHEKHRTEQP